MSELKLPSGPFFAVACGKCASEKSYLIRHLLYTLAKQGRIKHGLAFVPSSFDNELNYFPKEHLHKKFSMNVLENYIDKLTAVKRRIKRKHYHKVSYYWMITQGHWIFTSSHISFANFLISTWHVSYLHKWFKVKEAALFVALLLIVH